MNSKLLTEVLIISYSGSKDANTVMFDLDNGSMIETYKEGHSPKNGLDLIGDDFLICALEDKPKMKVWRIGHSINDSFKIPCPGVVSALAVSKCGQYCIAGIGPSTYIWELAGGYLVAHLQYHMQDITCVRFSSDGSHFITGGKDGMVHVFLLSDAIRNLVSPSEEVKPHFTWSDHVKEVTDIYVGYVGVYSKVATTSLDSTCKIYELDTGCHLCTIHMNAPLTCVTMDLCEYFLILGTEEGNIYKINLFNMSDSDMHFEEVAEHNAFVGHKKEITSLCVSHSGYNLISGSKDKQCRIWDISNYSCVRPMNFPGPVTNVFTSRVPPGIRNKNYTPHICVDYSKREECVDEEALINISSQNLSLFHVGAPDQFFEQKIVNCPAGKVPSMLKDNCSIDDLSSVNNSMYSFAIGDVFANTDMPE